MLNEFVSPCFPLVKFRRLNVIEQVRSGIEHSTTWSFPAVSTTSPFIYNPDASPNHHHHLPSEGAGYIREGRLHLHYSYVDWVQRVNGGGGERPEKVQEKTFLIGTLPYDLSILCGFKVELILKGLNFTNGTSIFNHEFVYLTILKFSDIY